LGGLFGRRFLLLTHTGRKSGQPRYAVVEIDEYDPATDTYYIASGFGRKSDWYQNILKTPEVTIQVGNKKMKAVAEPLSPAESGEVMVRYARKHPTAARSLVKVLGLEVDGSEESYRRAAQEHVPFVALHVQP
jgi:deazaflavin-dependent oxidoreductase (nitroreductase family)